MAAGTFDDRWSARRAATRSALRDLPGSLRSVVREWRCVMAMVVGVFAGAALAQAVQARRADEWWFSLWCAWAVGLMVVLWSAATDRVHGPAVMPAMYFPPIAGLDANGAPFWLWFAGGLVLGYVVLTGVTWSVRARRRRSRTG